MKKKIHPGTMPANEYLAVMLGACQTVLYMGNNKLLEQAAVITTDYKTTEQLPAKSATDRLSAMLHGREEAVKKFLHEIADTIGELSNQFTLPVFVFGSSSTISYFQRVNDFIDANVRFFNGQYHDTNAADLASIANCCTTQHC